jgi:endonuclease/exonuclease/phosphatase family metal-dependent hydrolase
MLNQKIKVLSWNIAGAHKARTLAQWDYTEADLDYFADILAEHQPDIVCLQENHANGNNSYSEYLAKAAGCPYVYDFSINKSHIDPNYWLTLTVLSKFRAHSVNNVFFDNPGWEEELADGTPIVSFETGVLMVRFADFWVYNVQFLPELLFKKDYRYGEGRTYVEKAMKKIGKRGGPLIMCGDFNSQKYEEMFDSVPAHKGFKNAMAGMKNRPTLNGPVPSDGIYYKTDTFRLCARDVQKTETDHYLCIAELGGV